MRAMTPIIENPRYFDLVSCVHGNLAVIVFGHSHEHESRASSTYQHDIDLWAISNVGTSGARVLCVCRLCRGSAIPAEHTDMPTTPRTPGNNSHVHYRTDVRYARMCVVPGH